MNSIMLLSFGWSLYLHICSTGLPLDDLSKIGKELLWLLSPTQNFFLILLADINKILDAQNLRFERPRTILRERRTQLPR